MKRYEFELELPENPKGTAQMIRHTTHGTYLPKNLKRTVAMYEEALRPYCTEMLTGPLALTICWVYEVKDRKKWGHMKQSVPDLDNIAKPFIDCMTRVGFWVDDSQIVKLKLEKWYGSAPMVGVVLMEVEE